MFDFPFSLTVTSSADHLRRSCMISAGSGGCAKFFLSKHACFASTQFRLIGVLFVPMFDKGVLGLRPKCAPKGEIFVTPCGVIRKVHIISATSEARRYGVFVLSILITASLRLSVCIFRSAIPIAR